MASKNARLNGSTQKPYYLYLVVNETSVGNSSQNNSTVSYRVYVHKGGGTGYWSGYSCTGSCNIGGNAHSDSWSGYDFRGITDWTLFEGTHTIAHNSDGSGSCSCSASFNSGQGAIGNADVSFTLSLTKINRYTACGAPTSVSLSSTRVVPGGGVTLSWSGATAGNYLNINGYDIYRNGAYLATVSTNATSGSYTVYAPSTRGSSYYYQVYTLASVGGYNSGSSPNSSNLYANRLPNTPNAGGSTTLPSTGGTVNFTASSNGDPDGQGVTLYYAFSSSGARSKYTGTVSKSITSTTTFYVWAHDGLEYSSNYATATGTVNVKPNFNISVNASTTKDVSGSRDLANSISVSGSGYNKGRSSYQYRIYNTSTRSYVGDTGSTSAASYNFTNAISSITRGEGYQVQMRYKDGIEWSDWKTSSTYYRPYSIQAPTKPVITVDHSVSDRTTYYNNNFEYTCGPQNNTTGYAPVTLSWGISYTTDDTYVTSSPTLVPRGATNVKAIATVTSFFESATAESDLYRRARLPQFINPKVEDNISVYSDSKGTYSFGIEVCDTNKIKYTLQSTANNEVLTLVNQDYFAYTEATVEKEFKTEILKQYYNNNKVVNLGLTYTFVITDEFGNSVTLSVPNKNIILAQTPTITNENGFSPTISYNNSSNYVGSKLTASSTNKQRILNNGDSFTITLPKDYVDVTNTESYDNITNYNFYLYYSNNIPTVADLKGKTITDIGDIAQKSPDITLSIARNETTYTHLVPSFSNNRFVYIALSVTNAAGLESPRYLADTYVVFAPTSLTAIESGQIIYQEPNIMVDYRVTNNYGAGSFTNTSDEYSYSNWPNLERQIDLGGDKQMPSEVVKVDVLASPTFDGSYEQIGSITQTTTTKNGTITCSAPTSGHFTLQQNLYIQFRVTVTSGFPGQTIVSTTSPVLFYAEGPTLSPRYHSLGFNYSQIGENEDDLFVIQGFQDKQKLRFIGTADVGGADITIDLTTLEVDGATLDGGSW